MFVHMWLHTGLFSCDCEFLTCLHTDTHDSSTTIFCYFRYILYSYLFGLLTLSSFFYFSATFSRCHLCIIMRREALAVFSHATSSISYLYGDPMLGNDHQRDFWMDVGHKIGENSRRLPTCPSCLRYSKIFVPSIDSWIAGLLPSVPEPVDTRLVVDASFMAQSTPLACNTFSDG